MNGVMVNKSKYSVSINTAFDSLNNAKKAVKTLESELTFQKKSSTEITTDKNFVVINIHSDDISAIHAATSSYLRALKVILSVL